MSQEKVDKYKEYKKNRKHLIEKEKKQEALRKLLGRIILAVIVIGLVAGVAVTIVNSVKTKRATQIANYLGTSYSLNDYSNIEGTTEAAEE